MLNITNYEKVERKQNHNEIVPHIGWLLPIHHHLKTPQRARSASVDVERWEASHTAGGNVKWHSHYGKLYGSSSTKLHLGFPRETATPLLGLCRKESKDSETCTVCTRNIIHSSRKAGTTQESPREGMAKQRVAINTVQYHLVLRRKEILARATTRMNLEETVLTEISQSQNDR